MFGKCNIINAVIFKKCQSLLMLMLGFFLTFGCSQKDFEVTDVLPEKTDGIFISRMNHIGQDKSFFGKWMAPRLGRNQRFFRSLKESEGGIRFILLKKESVLIDIEFYNEVFFLNIFINNQKYAAEGKRFRKVIPAQNLRVGENNILFTFPKKESISIQQVQILPKGYLNLKREFDLKHDCLTPTELVFYHNPQEASELRLRFIIREREPFEAKISIQSEGDQKTFTQMIKSKELICIPVLDASFHRITVELPETPSRHIRLAQSQFSRPKTKRTPQKYLRKAVDGKNLLWVLLDAARADHLSSYGYHRKTTPNIDALVDQGILCEDVLCEAAYTLASTGTLLTGLPPDIHRVVSAFFNKLAEDIKTFPELMQEKGFFTAAVSSNPFFGQKYNYHQGFEQFVELFQDKAVVDADEFLEPFKKLLEEKDERPFFIYLHIREPHKPYQVQPPFFGRFQKYATPPSEEDRRKMSRISAGKIEDLSEFEILTNAYDENLAFADHVTGQILDQLKAKGLFDETIIVVISDHGEALGEHGLVGHNNILLQEGIHIPIIIRIPGIDSPDVITRPAMTSDLVVTLCDLMEIQYPYPTQTLGKNLFTLPKKRTRICRSLTAPSNYTGYAVASYPYKLIYFPKEEGEDLQLYNLADDIGEKNPLDRSNLSEKALMSFLNNYINLSKGRIKTGEKPRLNDKEMEALKALGYIK